MWKGEAARRMRNRARECAGAFSLITSQLLPRSEACLSILIFHAALPVTSSTLQVTICSVTAHHKVWRCRHQLTFHLSYLPRG